MSPSGDGLCELNECGLEVTCHRDGFLIYSDGFLFQQIRKGKCYKSCQEIQHTTPEAVSGVYKIHPLPNAEPIEVYCELNIAGGGFSFLPHNLTMRSDAQHIVNALFKDKRKVLLKLQKKVDGSEWYTLIQPHPNYPNNDFGVLANSYSGYSRPKNEFMKNFIFLGILPASTARQRSTQGFRSNGAVVQFKNCDANPNSYFAFLPNHNHQTPHGHGSTSIYENGGVAVNWRAKAISITYTVKVMSKEFFFLTELHFGGCGCYTSSDRWTKFGFNATAIGIR